MSAAGGDRQLSFEQTFLAALTIGGLIALTALHDVSGAVTVPVLASLGGGVLGHMSGRRANGNGHHPSATPGDDERR